jgi:hypothetical protein
MLEGWQNLALNEARILKMRYPDDKPESEKTYSSRVKVGKSKYQRTMVLKKM